MKKNTTPSPTYATNRAGMICAPKKQGKDPASVKTVGDDLRAPRKRKGK